MKLLGMLLSILLLNNHATVILIDTDQKKPVGQTENFTLNDFLKRKFPIFSGDVVQVAEATEKAAFLIGHNDEFSFDSVLANRTAVIINTEKDGFYKVITVRLVTVIEDLGMSFDFVLVKKESDKRKIQKKLLDFAGYLSK